MSKRFLLLAVTISIIHLLLVFASLFAVGEAMSTMGNPDPKLTPVADFFASLGEKILWLPLLGEWTLNVRNLHVSIDLLFLFLNSLLWGFTIAFVASILTKSFRSTSESGS